MTVSFSNLAKVEIPSFERSACTAPSDRRFYRSYGKRVLDVALVVIAAPIWLPVIASALAFTMLPIAYISFFILNNKRSYMGDAVGKGWKRIVVNVILLVAVIMALVGAGIKIKGGVIDKISKMANKEATK